MNKAELTRFLSKQGIAVTASGEVAETDLDRVLAAINAKAIQKRLQELHDKDHDKFTEILDDNGCDAYASEPGMLYEWYGEMGVKKSKFHEACENDVATEGDKTLICVHTEDHDIVIYATAEQLAELEAALQ